MQGERTSVESLTEAFDIDHDHTSRLNSDQLYWNSVLNPPSPTLPDYLITPEDPNISYAVNINHRELGVMGDAREENKIQTGASNRRGSINLNRAFEGEEQEQGGDRVVTQSGTHPVYGNSYLPQMEQASLISGASGRRLLGKRKTMDGDPGQSSGSVAVQSFEGLNPVARVEQEDSEGLNPRSFRTRLNPGPRLDDVATPQWRPFSIGQTSVWSPPQQSPLFIPASQTAEVRLSAPNPNSQSPPLGFPLARTAASLTPAVYAERSTIIRGNNSNNPIHMPAPVDWSLNNGSNLNPVSGNSASSSQVGSVNPRVHYQNLPGQPPRNLSEFIRRTFPNAGPGVQPANPIPQNSLQPNPQDLSPSLPGVARGNYQHPLLRSAFTMDRRAAIMGAPLALRTLASSREGRSRMISEHIRNALDLMRRGENLRFEDVLILDHSAFYGLADLHDRHRDMRLDVDNMTYEELLALEERIGNVSTGLNDEVIRKRLKRGVFLSSEVKSGGDAVIEPCCVCQEDYVDGEEIGTLDCGHEFHADCVKQWLAHKNICPICKLTALVT